MSIADTANLLPRLSTGFEADLRCSLHRLFPRLTDVHVRRQVFDAEVFMTLSYRYDNYQYCTSFPVKELTFMKVFQHIQEQVYKCAQF